MVMVTVETLWRCTPNRITKQHLMLSSRQDTTPSPSSLVSLALFAFAFLHCLGVRNEERGLPPHLAQPHARRPPSPLSVLVWVNYPIPLVLINLFLFRGKNTLHIDTFSRRFRRFEKGSSTHDTPPTDMQSKTMKMSRFQLRLRTTSPSNTVPTPRASPRPSIPSICHALNLHSHARRVSGVSYHNHRE
jgi:hypothetical protein